MVKIAIDGSKATGHYRVDCECGDRWSGQGEPLLFGRWNPALPIAECIVHMKLEHPEGTPELRFAQRFSEWLQQYWQDASLREATQLTSAR
jgi:hypothetical protein